MYTMMVNGCVCLQQAFASESPYTDALPDLPVQLLPGAAVLAQPLPQPMCILPQQPLMQPVQLQQQHAVPFSSPEHSQESAASLRAPQVPRVTFRTVLQWSHGCSVKCDSRPFTCTEPSERAAWLKCQRPYFHTVIKDFAVAAPEAAAQGCVPGAAPQLVRHR